MRLVRNRISMEKETGDKEVDVSEGRNSSAALSGERKVSGENTTPASTQEKM